MEFEQGPFTEQLLVVVHAVRLCQVKFGNRAVLIGVGTICLLVCSVVSTEGVLY